MILSTHESSRIRNLAMSAMHHIAAEQLCEVADIIALISPSQPGTSHAPAADTPAPPPAGEMTDDAKGLSSLALASSVEPIQPSPLPGDSVGGEGIPPNRAPTPSAAFSNRKTQGPIEARLKNDVTARRTRLGL